MQGVVKNSDLTGLMSSPIVVVEHEEDITIGHYSYNNSCRIEINNNFVLRTWVYLLQSMY